MKNRILLSAVFLALLCSIALVLAEDEPCTDTDEGRNYYVRGFVEDNQGNSGWDGCYDDNFNSNEISGPGGKVKQPATGTKVTETFCDENDNYKMEIINCSEGCFNGACMPCRGCVLPGYSCSSNDECDTGKCRSGLCKKGFFRAVSDWFKELFGAD